MAGARQIKKRIGDKKKSTADLEKEMKVKKAQVKKFEDDFKKRYCI